MPTLFGTSYQISDDFLEYLELYDGDTYKLRDNFVFDYEKYCESCVHKPLSFNYWLHTHSYNSTDKLYKA